MTTTEPADSRGATRSTQESPQACLSMASVQPTPDQDPVSCPLSTRKTPRKADSGVAVQYNSKTASACETAVLQLKGSGRRTYLQQTGSALLLFSVIVPQGRELGRHSNVAVMQVHRQPESKRGDSLRSRVLVWLREKVDRHLILDVGERCGNTPR